MTDPSPVVGGHGPHDDQPHWTVKQGPVLDWDGHVLGVPDSAYWPDAETAYDELCQRVRDAAEVHALRTHATTLQRARELAQAASDASMDATGPEAYDAAVAALVRYLLTGETDDA